MTTCATAVSTLSHSPIKTSLPVALPAVSTLPQNRCHHKKAHPRPWPLRIANDAALAAGGTAVSNLLKKLSNSSLKRGTGWLGVDTAVQVSGAYGALVGRKLRALKHGGAATQLAAPEAGATGATPLPSPCPVVSFPLPAPAPSCSLLSYPILFCPVLCTSCQGRLRRAGSDGPHQTRRCVCVVLCVLCVCVLYVCYFCVVCVCCVTLCVSMQGPAGGGGAAAGDDGVRGRQRRPEAALLGLGPGGRAAAADGRAAASGPVRGPNLQFGIPAAVPRPLAGVPCLRFGPLLLGPVKDASKETAPQADRTGVA